MKQRKQKPYLTYALNLDGKLIHIDNVSTGLECKCFCPHCKSELIAKNEGKHRIHHFAHTNGSDCVGAIESALHKMAKDVLQEHKLIMLPPIQQSELVNQTRFKNVDVEAFNKELSLRPDCIGHTYDGGIIWVEFKRSHEVDVRKAGKIISAKIDCIEIDLNSCELDPNKVKEFIESNDKCRKWIYNHNNPQKQTFLEMNTHVQNTNFDKDNYFEQEITRHIAIDEQGKIVNLYTPNEIDANQHTYFCIACGKEVFINVDDYGQYSFAHLEENTPCENDFYLHEAAKKVFCEIFNTSQKFEIYVPQLHLCEKNDICPIFNQKCCSTALPIPYDLKAYGYDACEIEYKFPFEKFSCDAVLKRGNDLENAIILIINADRCYIEPENRKNRAIEVLAKCESDIFELYESPLNGIRYLNFKNNDLKTTPCENVNRKVLKFTLFSNGKYHFGLEYCTITKKESVIYEMIVPNGIETDIEIIPYAMFRCYNAGKISRSCEICYFNYKISSLDRQICFFAKHKANRKLNETHLDCQYFSLYNEIEPLLNKKYSNLEFIETDLSNNYLTP